MNARLQALAYAAMPLALPVALVGVKTSLPTAILVGVCLFIGLVVVLGSVGAVTLAARRPH